MKAMKAQGLSHDSLPYKAPFQPFIPWFALISTAIITIFKGEYLFASSLLSFKEYSQFSLGFDTFIPFTKDRLRDILGWLQTVLLNVADSST